MSKLFKPLFPVNPNIIHNFKTMSRENLDAYFRTNPDWGMYDPANNRQWFDKSAVCLTNRGVELGLTRNTLDGIKTGIGLISSKQTFSYGYFEWVINLPRGAKLWPAVWLTGADTWPPEIDVMEAYTDEWGWYWNKLNTNFYVGKTPNHWNLTARRHGLFIIKRFNINLRLYWSPEQICIYYNGRLVRIIKEEENLKHFNTGQRMRVVMNNAVSAHLNSCSKPFVVEKFTYSPLD